MTDVDTASSVSVNTLLREKLLMQEELAAAEVVHAGTIALLSVGRYGARLNANGTIIEFKLMEPEGEDDHLGIVQRYLPYGMSEELIALAWHRAAEAMLAVRQGHMEFNKRRKARKERD